MAGKKSEDHSKAGSESKKTEAGSGKSSGQGKVKDPAHDGRLKDNK